LQILQGFFGDFHANGAFHRGMPKRNHPSEKRRNDCALQKRCGMIFTKRESAIRLPEDVL
jgi:hypothetical protein